MTVGTRIRKIRENLGNGTTTMEQFGQLLYPPASKSAVSKWENNYNLPNKKRLDRISELDGITVGELVNNTNPLAAYSREELLKELLRRERE